MKSLSIDYEQYVFVDFGSGKGRALLMASAFPFAKVLGVEFSADFHRVASYNIRSYVRGKRRCGEDASILADAMYFPIPLMPMVGYFYNPFSGPVLRAVLENIQQSVAKHPRDSIIIAAGKHRDRREFERIGNGNTETMSQRDEFEILRVR